MFWSDLRLLFEPLLTHFFFVASGNILKQHKAFKMYYKVKTNQELNHGAIEGKVTRAFE